MPQQFFIPTARRYLSGGGAHLEPAGLCQAVNIAATDQRILTPHGGVKD